jgi:general secretion pathway protein A
VQPPPGADSDASLYESFYGLREQPFALSTDPRFIFWSASHRRAYDDLLVGLRRREGVLLLTGETGTGKTTLCRAVIDSLGTRTFSALVLNPYMSGSEVLRVILRDFGLVSREEIRRGSLSKADTPQLLDTLEGFLRSLVPLDARAVVVVDEAQSLAPEALDQVRMLGAYEEDGQRLLQIVLTGQPGLLNTLKTDALRALNERITRRAGLSPLLAPEVEAYVRHRLSVAGAESATMFSVEALGLVAEFSRGLPRRINVLCDRALDEGKNSGSQAITADILKRAARSLSSPSTAVPVISATEVTAPAAPAPVPALSRSGTPTRLVPPPPMPQMPAAGDEAAGAEFQTVPLFELEAETPRRGLSPAVLVAGGVLLAGALAAGYYVWSVAGDPPEMPKAPPVHLAIGAPAAPMPIPSDADLKDLMEGRWSIDGTAR